MFLCLKTRNYPKNLVNGERTLLMKVCMWVGEWGCVCNKTCIKVLLNYLINLTHYMIIMHCCIKHCQTLLLAFSLDAWKQTRGILSSGLTDEYRAELFQDLGLSQFVYEDNRRCSSSESPYIGAVENWNNGRDILLVIVI